MTCPHCGAEVAPGNTFCHCCRKSVIAPGSSGSATGRATPLPSRPVARPSTPSTTGSVGGKLRRPGGIQGPAFWTTGSVDGTRRGYVFKLHPGPASGTGLASFAYTAEPASRGQTGNRRFCADDTGIIWTDPDPSYPLVKDGRCFGELRPIR